MHAARLETSPRLKSVMAALWDGEWHSTMELAMRTGGCAIHSDIAELRANGIEIESRYEGVSANGRRVYAYRAALPQGTTCD